MSFCTKSCVSANMPHQRAPSVLATVSDNIRKSFADSGLAREVFCDLRLRMGLSGAKPTVNRLGDAAAPGMLCMARTKHGRRASQSAQGNNPFRRGLGLACTH